MGVVVNEDYETERYIRADRAVILTAGGFCNNKALLDKYIPTAAMGCASSYLTAGERGECFRMGLGVGADVSGFNSSASFDGGVDWQAEGGTWRGSSTTHDPALAPAVADYRPLRQPPTLHGLARGRGRRQRHLRLGRFGHHPDDPAGPPLLHLFDANYEDHLAGFAQEHCRKLLTPDLEQIEKVPEHYRDWHHGVQDAIDATC